MHKQKRSKTGFLRVLTSQTALLVLLAASAQAAVLTDIEGVVHVNHGDGFKLASVNAVLVPGDRVRAAVGSAAVRYENGCSMKVRPKQTLVVLATAPVCTGGGLKDGVGAGESPAVVSPPDEFAASLLIGTSAGAAAAIAQANSGTQVTPSVSP